MVAGVKHFHEYLYGQRFKIIMDHKPLLGLLAGDKQTSNFMAPRMRRWTIFLTGYNYKLTHRPGTSISNADGLNRCLTLELVEDPGPVSTVLLIDIDPDSPTMSHEMQTTPERTRYSPKS